MNLINVAKRTTQPLIQAPVETSNKEKAFFFTHEENGLMLHFIGRKTDSENNHFNNWYSMPLDSDFVQRLQKHGRLPEPSTNACFDEIAQHE